VKETSPQLETFVAIWYYEPVTRRRLGGVGVAGGGISVKTVNNDHSGRNSDAKHLP